MLTLTLARANLKVKVNFQGKMQKSCLSAYQKRADVEVTKVKVTKVIGHQDQGHWSMLHEQSIYQKRMSESQRSGSKFNFEGQGCSLQFPPAIDSQEFR